MINGISENEKRALNQVIENIFNKLEVHDWESIELNKYRKDPKGFIKFLRGEYNPECIQIDFYKSGCF
jgi:hypothetical protein